MASFGRRPGKKDSGHGIRQPANSRSGSGSDSFRRMMEEEEERLQFAKEYEEREGSRTLEGAASDDVRGRGSPPRSGASNPHSTRVKDEAPKHRGPNPRVFLQIEIRNKATAKQKASGRLEFELLADTVPKTAENFRCLCTGEKGGNSHFLNCLFHNVTPGLSAQGGDITAGNGSGGCSIYGEQFDDENFLNRHDARGMLSMANTGRNTNNSQFHLMFIRAKQMDKKNVVFGKMIRDEDNILRSIEDAGTKSGVPQSLISIIACGEIGGSNRTAQKARSRSRSRNGRVQFDSDGRIDFKALRSGKGDGRIR